MKWMEHSINILKLLSAKISPRKNKLSQGLRNTSKTARVMRGWAETDKLAGEIKR